MSAKVQFDRGAWWVITHHEGKRRRRRLGPSKADKRAAEEIAKKINAAIALGTFAPDRPREKPLPCDAQLRRWHETYSPTMKLTSEVSFRGLIEHHLAPFFRAKDLREIREADLLDFVRAKLEQGLAPKTVQNALGVLRRVLYLAQREGSVARNPAARVGELMRRVDRRIATETPEVEYWTPEEAATLIALAREHEPRFAPALVLAFSTGCRKGEILGLKWQDVDFERRTLAIRRAITMRQVTTPKSGRGRSVAMTETLAHELFDVLAARRQHAAMKARAALESGAAERASPPPEWVFCSRTATPWDETNFARHWERVRRRGEAEGVRPLRFHATRHSWATWALRAGKSVRWVAQQLGHQDPAFTLRVYAHAMREEEKDLSFAELGGPGRPYTAPAVDGDSEETTQPIVFAGGPPGTRTQNQRVKSPLLYH